MRRHHWEQVRRSQAWADRLGREAEARRREDLDGRAGGGLSALLGPRRAESVDAELLALVDVAQIEKEEV
jgi:hypothetical protein